MFVHFIRVLKIIPPRTSPRMSLSLLWPREKNVVELTYLLESDQGGEIITTADLCKVLQVFLVPPEKLLVQVRVSRAAPGLM